MIATIEAVIEMDLALVATIAALDSFDLEVVQALESGDYELGHLVTLAAYPDGVPIPRDVEQTHLMATRPWDGAQTRPHAK